VAARTCSRPFLQEEEHQTALFGLATNCTLEPLRSQPPATATTTRSAEEELATWDFKAAAASGTPREQERVEEEEQEEEDAGDTAMPGEGSARMTIVETAMAEQTTKLPKPQEQAQNQKESGR
jgi:hypothetical protein